MYMMYNVVPTHFSDIIITIHSSQIPKHYCDWMCFIATTIWQKGHTATCYSGPLASIVHRAEL